MAGEFSYLAVSRLTRVDGDLRQLYFVREKSGAHELAPWFENRVTAMEMAMKCERGDEFTDRIPCVPVGTCVPRPKTLVFIPTAEKPRGPSVWPDGKGPPARKRIPRGDVK